VIRSLEQHTVSIHGVVQPELAAFELPRLEIEVIHEGDLPRCHLVAAVVVVGAEEVSVVVDRELTFGVIELEVGSSDLLAHAG
jgi:hypothetical protein